MNPWKIIGWIVLGCLVLTLGFCGLVLSSAGQLGSGRSTAAPVPAQQGPAGQVEVVARSCEVREGLARADITVRNVGVNEIRGGRVFVEFLSASNTVVGASDSYFQPMRLPPNSLASATLYSPRGAAAAHCNFLGLQTDEGRPILGMQ